MYICVNIELLTISISLVDVTMMDLWKNKKIIIIIIITTTTMKDAYEDKRIVLLSASEGKREENRSVQFNHIFCAAL